MKGSSQMIWSKCRLAGALGWWAHATNSMFSTTFCTSLPWFLAEISKSIQLLRLNPSRLDQSISQGLGYQPHHLQPAQEQGNTCSSLYIPFFRVPFSEDFGTTSTTARVGDQENGARLHISQIQRGIRVIRIKKSAATIARNWVYLWKIILYFCNGA